MTDKFTIEEMTQADMDALETEVKELYAAQIAECQAPRVAYVAAHEDARKRIEAGEQQVFCKLCERWKWRRELCGMHRL